ncbi:MAG: choice-of-anchor J domain-containing protein, partial [Thermoplasmatales archaeon]|nr:choice-of-anchor J domain-containing protein [Thermoplasmatales archaeon]
MKEKNVIGSLVLRKGIVAAIAILLLGTGLMIFFEAEARTDPCVITGYVYDENGNPLPGATVIIRDLNTGAWGENTTDADGLYSITLGGGPMSPPWMEWFGGDGLLAVATYDGREGKAFRYIDEEEIDDNGFMWLDITLGTPITTKTIGEPEFIKYDYDDGYANYGYLVSERIDVTADTAYLDFWTWWQIEGAAPSSFDLMNVYISTDGGYNWELLKTLNPDSDPEEPNREYLYYGSNGFNTTPVWKHETIDISAYVPNEIIIIFEFDTVDDVCNFWEGWYIDDIKITEFGGNVPFSDDVENGVQNWTYNGYWHISEHRSRSSSHAWYYGIEHSYVTSETPITFEVEGDYNQMLYRIYFNNTWHPINEEDAYCGNEDITEIDGTYWYIYPEGFEIHFHEECMHIIEFYAENGTNSEPVHNQTHYVDNSPPVSEYWFDGLTSTLNFGGHDFIAIKKCTPMIINAYDMPEGCAAGVEWLNYTIWWNANEPNNYTKIKEVRIHDNDVNDTDKRVGFITAELHFTEECFHEIKWSMVDYFGHASPQYSLDIAVDGTPPTIEKTIGEPKYIDERGWLWVNCSTPIWFNISDGGCGGGVGVWMFGMNIYWNETRVPAGEQQEFTLVEEIVVVDNLAEITMEVYNESKGWLNLTKDVPVEELEELLSNPNESTWYINDDEYEIYNWVDNGNGTLDYCDYIDFDNSTWHVEALNIEIKDLDPDYGEISYLFRFNDLPENYTECFHEPEIWAIDYVGNNYSFKEKDMVDCTPPAIYKTIEKIVALEQTEINTGSYTDITDYQSFKAPFSYIDAVSVYVTGNFDLASPVYVEIYEDDDGWPGDTLATSEWIWLSGNYTGWLQFHLPERLYVEHDETYWIGLIYGSSSAIKWEAQNNYPEDGPYPDGFAIVDGFANYSWDFTFKIEYYPIYPYNYPYMYSLYNETLVETTITKVAIFEDYDLWGLSSIQQVLDLHGIAYDIYGSSDIGNVDLSQYDKVIIASDQTTAFYDAVEANLDWFEEYALNGGQLEIHAADQGWQGGSWNVMPGGFTHVQTYLNYVVIEIPGHEVLTYPNVITDEELDNWGYSTHGYLTDLPSGSEIVLTSNDQPVFVVSPYGRGCIIISTQTLEFGWAWGYSSFLENVILYCPLLGYADYLNNTYLTTKAILDLSSWDEGCMDGVGLRSLMYRIYVDETDVWHPIDYEDYYCGNTNITYVDGEYWYVAINETVEFTKISFHEECEHILQIRAEDKVGNVRIVEQTHYVDDSPPRLKVEYPDEHGFYYDEQTGKQFVRACKEFYLNLTDEPDCAVGWRDFVFYFRYEYTDFTTPYIEKHPVDENDTQYGEVVNISGVLWWRITPQTPSIALHFYEECYHKIYYFYEATDWLDNSINESGIEEIYVDEFEPEVAKEHPPCYKEEESIYLHVVGDDGDDDGGIFKWVELYPEYGREYEYRDEFEHDDKVYFVMYDEKYGVVRLYEFEDETGTLYLYNDTYGYMYVEWYGGETPFNPGSLWLEVYPEFGIIYNLTEYDQSTGNVTLNNTETGEISEWHIEDIQTDIKVKPVPFLQACSRINLTAKDMPYELVVVDQFQTEGNQIDTLQRLDATPWPWDAQTFMPNASYINATALYIKWIGDADVTVYIHDLAMNVIATATKHLTGAGEDWVLFEFEPGVSVTPNATYYIEAHGSPASVASWYFNEIDLYTRGHAWISGEEKEEFDWKFQILSYKPNPCASGIEGIYYAYEFNDTRHPINETDAPHGEKIVNITQYYDWEEIEEEFGGYWLWYEYDDSVGVHFYEECIHWLYYWAKDNVCHHTPVYMQVYHVDEFEPEVTKEHPEHGYYTPVEIVVDSTFANYTHWLEGQFHVRDKWYYQGYADGWIPNPSGQYTDKIQYINFTIYNNDMSHDLILRLHVEEVFGDAGITLENGSDVNSKVYTINVPAGSSLDYTVNVYDNLELLRMGVWNWWAEVENVTQYLRAGARINLSANDPGNCPSGIDAIYYRYEWNGTSYPAEHHPAARNGSEIQPGVPEIANYWWFIYDDSVGIIFKEECQHDLYYFAKDRACHNSTLHHQIYYVDASEPVISEELPEHGAIGSTITSLYESFEAPFGNGWAVVNGDGSTWSIKSEEPLFLWHANVAHSWRYAALAWTYNSPCAWLITPEITIPEDGNLTFWYKVYYGGSAGLKVGINNVSYQTDTSAFVEIWDSGIFSDTNYRHVEIDLSAYAGQSVYIGFHCYYLSDTWPNNGLLIDDVWVGAIHRVATLLDDDVENGYEWTIKDLTVTQPSYWQIVNRLPVASPPSPGWSETVPNRPAVWCGDLSLGNAPNNGGGLYACNWDDTLTMKNPVNLADVDGTVELSFNIWHYLQSGDNLYVEASNDSINWTILETISGQNGWVTKTINISQYIGNSTLWIRFRFVSDDNNGQYNGVFIDNVTIKNETQTFFFDAFNTLANWNAEMLETSKWHITDYDYHSENHSWYCGVESAPHYLNCMNDALI